MIIVVLIPAYNEAARLASVLRSLPRRIKAHRITPLVIDDGSSDDTAEIAQDNGAVVLRHLINRGQGAALKTGIDYCLNSQTDIVVTFDADGQHLPEEIERIVEPILTGDVDVVLGSRFLMSQPTNIPSFRRLVLKTGVVFTRIISRIRVTDTHNGFRAFHCNALRKMTLVQDKMEHASEILDQISVHKLTYREVPVTVRYTKESLLKGQNNLNSLKIAFKMIAHKLR